jgi:nitrate reductase beta subunit
VLLYDADRIVEVAEKGDTDLVEAHRSMILDPSDPAVIEAARRNGIDESVIQSAQRSPVYKFVKVWGIALPPHIEFRTLPMLFYVPPLLPVMSARQGEIVENVSEELFHTFDQARAPMAYLSRLLSAGNEGVLKSALRKQMAVRIHRRAETVGDVDRETADRVLREAGTTREEADDIFRLTALCTFDERFVIPPMHREEAIEMMKEPHEWKQEAGFGFRAGPQRGA